MFVVFVLIFQCMRLFCEDSSGINAIILLKRTNLKLLIKMNLYHTGFVSIAQKCNWKSKIGMNSDLTVKLELNNERRRFEIPSQVEDINQFTST